MSGEAVEQVAQRVDGCPIPRNIQGQAEWVFEQPHLVEYFTYHYLKGPFQFKLFHDSMIEVSAVFWGALFLACWS